MTRPFEEIQKEILDAFKKIGIPGEIGTPHLQRDNAQLIIPKKKFEKKQILK